MSRSEAMRALDDEAATLRQALDEDGFVVVRAMLTAAARRALAQRAEALFDSGRARSRQVLYIDGQVPPDTPHLDHLLHQWLNPHRFAHGEGTADLLGAPRAMAARLLGAPPVLFQDLLLVKEAGQARFPWHQDFPFWPIDTPRGLVCWAPLVSNTEQAGGLMFARGSHRLGPLPVVDLHRGHAQDRSAHLPIVEDLFETVCPALQPGDAVLFSPLVMHGSPPRDARGGRIAWSSIWLHPSVRWSHARAPAHPLCREVSDGGCVQEWSPDHPR